MSNWGARPYLFRTETGARVDLATYYTGTGKLSYQWYRDGRLLPGVRSKTLPLISPGQAQRGAYMVEIKDAADGAIARKYFFVNVVVPKGHLLGLGDNTHGQSDVPATLLPPNRIEAIAAGGGHSLAISGGHIRAWGDNTAGQCEVPALNNVPAYAVAAGAAHSLALLETARVIAWGDNTSAQCDVPASLGPVRAIAAGGGHSLAVQFDGQVVGWGDNSSGQTSITAFSSTVVAIAAGHDHSLVLLENGQVIAWGANDRGQCEVPSGLRNIVSIGAAGDASFAVTKTGRVHVWGDTSFGQTPAPTKLKPVASAAGGWDFIASRLSTGGLSFWGDGAEALAAESKGLGKIYALAAGGGHVLALRNGYSDAKPRIVARPAGKPSTTWDQAVELSVTAKGTLLAYQWYHHGQPIPGATEATYRIDAMRLSDVGTYSVRVFNGASYVDFTGLEVAYPSMPPLAVDLMTPRRQVVGVGERLRIEVSGQGAGNLSYSWFRDGERIPGQTSAVLDLPVTDESAGGTYIAEIRDQGHQQTYRPSFVVVPPVKPTRIVAWGDNSLGQTSVPDGLQDVIKLTAGQAHTLALRANGTVVAWGDDRNGQCSVPAGLTEVVDIAASEFYSAALKADGTITAWGGDRDPVIHTTNDPQVNSIQISSRGVYTYTTPAQQRVLSQLPSGGVLDYSLNGNNVSFSVIFNNPAIPLPEPASSTSAKMVYKSFSGSSMSTSLTLTGTIFTSWVWWETTISDPAPAYAPSFTDSDYDKSVDAFSHYNGRSATIRPGKTGRFWTTSKHNSQWQNFEIRNGVVIADVSAVLAGGSFFSWLRGDGVVGGFGNHIDFHGAPYRITGMKQWCAGRNHTAALLAADTPAAPQVLEFSASRAVGIGESVRLQVRASGEHLRYQWLLNDEPIIGADTPKWLLVGFDATKAGTYRVRISDGFTTVTSAACDLSLGMSPVFVQTPAPRLGLRVGERLELNASLADADGCRFEWRHNGVVLEDERGSILVREAAGMNDAGRYTLRVTGENGATTLATSHVFVLPVAGTRIVHEQELAYPLGEQKPWSAINDAVDFIVPGGVVLRLDGRVVSWGNRYATEEWSAWLAQYADIVAISDWGLLRANGQVVIPPGTNSNIPPEILGLRNVIALTSNPRAVLLDDGRAAFFEPRISSFQAVPALHWLPSVGELADAKVVRVLATPEQKALNGHHDKEFILVAAGVDGTVVSSSPGGFLSFPELPSARRVRGDGDKGVSIIDAEGSVHPATILGRTRTAGTTRAEIPQTETSYYGRAELGVGGSVRAWKTTRSETDWSEVERPAYPIWKRDNLRVRLDSSDVMVLRLVDSLPKVSFASSRQVFAAGQRVVLEASLDGVGDLDLVWERNGVILNEANSPRLELPADDPRNPGWYRVRATDADGNFHEAVVYVQIAYPGSRIEPAPPYKDSWVAPDWTDIVDIGGQAAIRADGSVAMWDAGTGAAYGVVPDSVREVVAVLPGAALDASGRLTQWNPATGEVIRQIEGVLWIRQGYDRTGFLAFAIMRNGTVHSLDSGSRLYGNNPEIVDIRYADIGYRYFQIQTRRDGSVLIESRIRHFGSAPKLLSPDQLGGTLLDAQATSTDGVLLLVETSDGRILVKETTGQNQPTDIIAFDEAPASSLGLNAQGDLVSLSGEVLRAGVARLNGGWILVKNAPAP